LRITPTRNLIFTGHFNITLGEEKIRIYKLSKNYVAKQPCLLDNVETIMKKTDALGQFEQLVLTAVLLCGEKAYGMAVHEKVEELGERRVNSYSTFVPHPVSSTNLWDPALHEVRSKTTESPKQRLLSVG